MQDADEPGINGVTVTATADDGTVLTTVTSGDGDYLFDLLDDGTYVVEVVSGVPDGFGPTADADSPADGSNSAGDETSTVDLVSADLEQDFGYAGNSSLGDRLWLDVDGNGAEDADEPRHRWCDHRGHLVRSRRSARHRRRPRVHHHHRRTATTSSTACPPVRTA